VETFIDRGEVLNFALRKVASPENVAERKLA
jgi:hypothetical protein